MPLQVIRWSPPCLFCVSGIHRERSYGSTTSTHPITVHERTAIYKSQLEPIIENPGNTWGAEQAFGRWFADGLYRGLVFLQRRLCNFQPSQIFFNLVINLHNCFLTQKTCQARWSVCIINIVNYLFFTRSISQCCTVWGKSLVYKRYV